MERTAWVGAGVAVDDDAYYLRGARISTVWPLPILCSFFRTPHTWKKKWSRQADANRYLLMAGKEEKAWKVISDLHADPKDPDNDYAKSEFYQMSHQATLDRTLNPSWKQLLTKPSYRKRVVLGKPLVH